MKLPKSIRELFAEAGKRGGKAKSDAKTRAARANAKKPRPGRRKPKPTA